MTSLCCVLEQDTFIPWLSTGSTQEDPSQHVDWNVKNQIKQTKMQLHHIIIGLFFQNGHIKHKLFAKLLHIKLCIFLILSLKLLICLGYSRDKPL